MAMSSEEQTSMRRTRNLRLLALLGALSLLVTACLGGGGGGGAEGGGDGGTEGGGGGQTVTIMSPWVETDEERFLASLEEWEQQTGNTVQHEGSGDFETLINTRVQGGNPPDIAMVPQPGLVENLIETDALIPLDDVVQDYQESVGDQVYDLGVYNDQLYGILYLLSVKSLVWHPKPEFEEAGYEVPETWSDMLALTEQIKADGTATAPWCIGIESAGATGWVITDWFEDLMLQVHGPEVYDQWVNHEIPFTAPEVQEVGEMFAELAFTEGNVLGGRDAIITTPFGDQFTPMFEDPPGCMLGKQAQFITAFFPDDVQSDVGSNVGIFEFPDVEGGYEGSPLLISGDQAVMLQDNPAARSLIQYMASAEGGAQWAEQGGRISPHSDFDLARYPDELNRQIAELVQSADTLAFDGSDAMPGAVGAGSFWTEMVSWVNGEVDLETALQNIENSWPTEAGGGSTEGG
jgi:alpha-glucoside transport system substrate-binding protein